MPQIPIILLDGRTQPIEQKLATISNKHAPVTLRERFLFRRGIIKLAPNACVVVLAHVEQRMQSLCAWLRQNPIAVVFAMEIHPTAKQREMLLSLPYASVISAYTMQHKMYSDAVFCAEISLDILRELRKNGVRMVITNDRPLYGEIPFGMDVLYVSKEAQTANEQTKTALLPLDEQPLFSSLHLAIPLSIIGAKQELLYHALSCGNWETSYEPKQDRYCVHSVFDALRSTLCDIPAHACEGCRAFLTQGFYIELQSIPRIHELGDADRLLLYGYDHIAGTFTAQTTRVQGVFERIELLPQTLEKLCASHGVSMILHKLLGDCNAYDTERFAENLQTQKESRDGIYFDREATIRYANRFYKRFADGNEFLSAASLRTFLQERVRYGFAFLHLAKREDFYTEPFEQHVRLLATTCKPALNELCGKEWLQPDMPLYLTSELMRNLLHAEESCIEQFLDAWERAKSRRAYLQGF